MSTVNVDTPFSSKSWLDAIGDIVVWQLCGIVILFSAAFFNLVSLDADKNTVGLDGQVYLKLLIIGCAGLYGGMGFITDARIRKIASSFPLAWIFVIFCLYSVASLFAIEPGNSMASSFSILCVYLMTITALVGVGKLATVKTIFYATGLFVVGSWVVYFLAPSIGVMEEPISGGDFTVRMSGLSHPNTLGQHASICCILGTALYFSYGQKNLITLFFVVLAVGALLNCLSRTAMVATVAAIAVAYRQKLFAAISLRRALVLLAIAIVMLMVVSTQFDFADEIRQKLALFAKSGEPEEITSATGRGEIWAETIQLIQQQPALGYGPASSKYLLEDYSMYAHNLLLNIALSCGVGGLIVGLIMCFSRIRMMFSNHNAVADGLAVFVLISGLFENVIFSNLCGAPTIVWIVALAWFQFDNNEQTCV